MTINRIPSAWIGALFPGIDRPGPVTLNAQLLSFQPETMPALLPHEHLILAALTRCLAPKRVLEIGTAQGRGTVLLAANSPDETKIVTVDLPPNQRDGYTQSCLHNHNDVGQLFAQSPWAAKVVQILADTGTLDPAALRVEHGAMDLILVDGDHSYDGVRRDTELAVALASENTVIFWHDFYLFPDYVADTSGRRGVYPFLNQWNGGDDWELYQVTGTYFVTGRRRGGWPADLPTIPVQPGAGGAGFGLRIPRIADTIG